MAKGKKNQTVAQVGNAIQLGNSVKFDILHKDDMGNHFIRIQAAGVGMPEKVLKLDLSYFPQKDRDPQTKKALEGYPIMGSTFGYDRSSTRKREFSWGFYETPPAGMTLQSTADLALETLNAGITEPADQVKFFFVNGDGKDRKPSIRLDKFSTDNVSIDEITAALKQASNGAIWEFHRPTVAYIRGDLNSEEVVKELHAMYEAQQEERYEQECVVATKLPLYFKGIKSVTTSELVRIQEKIKADQPAVAMSFIERKTSVYLADKGISYEEEC